MKWRGGGDGERGEMGDKAAEGQKIDDINLPPYFLVCDVAFILSSLLLPYFFFLLFGVPLVLIRLSFSWVCLCVRAQSSHMCVCQVCVNRDERVRAWPCIIHAADLAEESRGSHALL